MASKRPLRTQEEKDRARDFVRYLGQLAGVPDPYDLATKAGLPRETVRGWWYGSSVPDGVGLLELLRAAGVLDEAYRLPGEVSQAEAERAAEVAETEAQAAEDRLRDASESRPASRERTG